MDLEGTTLDRYRLVRLLGTGGMSDVYLAEDPRVGQQVAIKVVRDDHSSGESREIQRFLREVRAIAQLDHPHILPLFDYGEAVVRGFPILYLVMPLRKEGSLADWLKHDGNAARLSGPDIASLLNQAASALQHAHDRQIIHQDVKPSNFLLRLRPGAFLPDLFLADFGIARLSSASSQISQSPRGTPIYMAPEQWSSQPVPATDQYALAAMAYELLVQRPPFQGNPHQVMYQHFTVQPQPPSAFHNRVPSALDSVVLRGLAKEPAARFPSINSFAAAFEQVALQAPPAGVTPSEKIGSDPVSVGAGDAAIDTPGPTLHEGRAAPGSILTDQARMTPTTLDSSHRPELFTSPQRLPTPMPVAFTYKRNRRRVIALSTGALILLLALGGILLPLLRAQQQGHLSATATTGPSQQKTPVSTVTPTTQGGLSLVGATFTVPANWKLLLDDPLHDNSKGYRWETSSGLFGAQCAFSSGSYSSNVGAGDTNTCTAGTTNFSDLAYQAQMTLRAGDCGGIAFRGNVSLDPNTLSYAFYYFTICQDGTYAFSVIGGLNVSLGPTTSTPLIHTGLDKTNTLAVISRGQQIQLFINQQQVKTLTDTTYTHGVIGVVATGLNSSTTAVFSNVRVWAP